MLVSALSKGSGRVKSNTGARSPANRALQKQPRRRGSQATSCRVRPSEGRPGACWASLWLATVRLCSPGARTGWPRKAPAAERNREPCDTQRRRQEGTLLQRCEEVPRPHGRVPAGGEGRVWSEVSWQRRGWSRREAGAGGPAGSSQARGTGTARREGCSPPQTAVVRGTWGRAALRGHLPSTAGAVGRGTQRKRGCCAGDSSELPLPDPGQAVPSSNAPYLLQGQRPRIMPARP